MHVDAIENVRRRRCSVVMYNRGRGRSGTGKGTTVKGYTGFDPARVLLLASPSLRARAASTVVGYSPIGGRLVDTGKRLAVAVWPEEWRSWEGTTATLPISIFPRWYVRVCTWWYVCICCQ